MTQTILALLTVLLLAAPVAAQVAFDAGSSGNNAAGDLSTLVIPHTTSTLPNRVLYCSCWGANEMVVTDLTATYAGEAMDPFYTQQTNRFFRVFRKLNPATGTNDFVCTPDNQPAGRQTSCICASFTGVDQSDPDDAPVEDTGSGTASSVSVSSATGDMVLDQILEGGSVTNLAPGGSQTQIAIIGASGLGTYKGGMSYWTGASSRTMTWSWTEFQTVSAAGWNINAAAASAVSSRGKGKTRMKGKEEVQ